MDEAERKRLRAKFKELCEGAGYPDGTKPVPWNIDTKPAKHEELVQRKADNNETPE